MFQEVPLRLWMFQEKGDIIILAKAVGGKPQETPDYEGLCRIKPVRAFLLPGGEACAQKTIEALQVSRLPKPDGWTVLPGTPKESRQGLQPLLPYPSAQGTIPYSCVAYDSCGAAGTASALRDVHGRKEVRQGNAGTPPGAAGGGRHECAGEPVQPVRIPSYCTAQ